MSLSVVQAEIEQGPQGQPLHKPIQKFEFSTGEESAGVDASEALQTIVERFGEWTNMLIISPKHLGGEGD